MVLEVFGAFMTSVAYSLVMQVPSDKIIPASVNGAFAWFIFLLLNNMCGFQYIYCRHLYVNGYSIAFKKI